MEVFIEILIVPVAISSLFFVYWVLKFPSYLLSNLLLKDGFVNGVVVWVFLALTILGFIFLLIN